MNIMNYREDAMAHCYADFGLREASCLTTKTNSYACAKCQKNHKKHMKKGTIMIAGNNDPLK